MGRSTGTRFTVGGDGVSLGAEEQVTDEPDLFYEEDLESICKTKLSKHPSLLGFRYLLFSEFMHTQCKHHRLIVTVHCDTSAELIQYTTVLALRYWRSIYWNLLLKSEILNNPVWG